MFGSLNKFESPMISGLWFKQPVFVLVCYEDGVWIRVHVRDPDGLLIVGWAGLWCTFRQAGEDASSWRSSKSSSRIRSSNQYPFFVFCFQVKRSVQTDWVFEAVVVLIYNRFVLQPFPNSHSTLCQRKTFQIHCFLLGAANLQFPHTIQEDFTQTYVAG